jgi:hypothetical protein
MKNKIIKEVRFSYTDKTYKLGPFVDFIAEMEVPSTDYETIVQRVEDMYLEYDNIKILSFKHG